MTETEVAATVESLIAKGLALSSISPNQERRYYPTRKGRRLKVRLILTSSAEAEHGLLA